MFGGVTYFDNYASQNSTLNWLLSQRDTLERSLTEGLRLLDEMKCPYGNMHPNDVIRSARYSRNPQYRKAVDDYLVVERSCESVRRTLIIIKRRISVFLNDAHLVTEADISVAHAGAVRSEVTDTHQNLVDVGGEIKDEVLIHHSFNHPVNSEDLQIKGFFERPVQIAKIGLDLDSDFDLSYNIWDLFMSDPTVRAKFRNYAFARFNMNIRIAVSGTPFHYGRLLVAYEPFPSVNQPLSSFGPTYRYERLKYLSQAPGAKTIDIRENTPFEVHIPYVSPQPVGRLYNDSSTVLLDTDTYDDFHSLGTLYISTLNQIKAVSTTATNVYLYIYAYADSVQLGSATGTVMEVTAESDERVRGPVETFATNAMAVTSVLEQIPPISIFAKASTIAMGGLKAIAALFGWSYPVMIDKPVRQRPDPYQNGAQTIGMDTGKRITLDPKCELSVDPRIMGVDEDELAITAITSRESFVSQFTWAPGTVPLVDTLWATYVTPRANEVITVGSKVVTMPSALSFAATPFGFWRGTIEYRLEIVASNFHRGKLMIVYEPNTPQIGLIGSGISTNKQYTKVIDIQETQSVNFTVDWNFPRPWARNIPDTLMSDTMGSGFTATTTMLPYANGAILITPFTELQSPDTSSIQINVYVRSTDMKFNRFTDENLPLLTAPFSVSGESLEIMEVDAESDTLNQRPVTDMAINRPVMEQGQLSADFFGEMPISFRALLKRFESMLICVAAGASQANFNTTCTFKIWPDKPSEYANGSKFSNLYHYLRKAFLGQRGSLRRRVLIRNDTTGITDQRSYSVITVRLLNDSDTTASYSAVSDNSFDYPNYQMDGTIVFIDNVNSGIEFEVPNYTNNLFQFACNDDPWYDIPVMEQHALRNYQVIIGSAGKLASVSALESFAAGEDFMLMRWLAAYPVVLNASSPG